MITKIMAAFLGLGSIFSGLFKFATMFLTIRWLGARRKAKDMKEQRDKVLSREKTDAEVNAMPRSSRRDELRKWGR